MQLTVQQEAAIDRLSTGTPVRDVAEQLQVDRTTIYRWLKQPDFAGEMAARRSVARGEVIAQLHNDATKAGRTVAEIVSNPKVQASVRLRAAEILLDRVLGQAEVDALAERVRELETTIEELRTFHNA